METTLTPPVIPAIGGKGKEYPTPTSRIGRAWAVAWVELHGSTEPVDGTVLAERAANRVRPALKPVTMTQLFARMAKAGILVEEKQPAAGSRGIRMRSFYRVPCPECVEYAGTGGESIDCSTCGKPGL